MRPEDLVHFCAPSRLIIGCGARRELPALLERLGYRRGVVVTDSYFVNNTPWVRELVDASGALGIRYFVFDGGEPDPTTTLCNEATARVLRALDGQMPDHVIALGGGSNIDLAKALCLTLPQGRPVQDFIGDLAGCKPLPLIALPTTSGTGSEATPGAILLDPDNATKVAVMDNALRPLLALVDPEFTYTCPPRVTADAGIDALTHAIESFVTLDSALYERGSCVDPGYSGRSSLTMMFARESMRLCAAWLERAYTRGDDTQARIGMSYASIYAALSYGSAGLNAGHGIAYAVAGQTHKSHGSTNAVILPYVIDALRDVRFPELLEVARIFGITEPDGHAAVRRLPVELRALVARLGIPTDLRSFGIEEASRDALLRDALGVARLAKAFPVADIASAYEGIIDNAWRGSLAGDHELSMA
jgi:alcohol dehydrogenase class IV